MKIKIRYLKRTDYPAWKKAKSLQLPMQNRFDSAKPALSDLTRSKFNAIIRRQIKNRKEDKSYQFGVFAGEQLVGTVTLGSILRTYMHTASIGYHIFNNHWGKGYGSQALTQLLEFSFVEQKLHRLVAGIEPGNNRSINLVRKFNFRREGISKRAVLFQGKWLDLIQYALTCEEYGVIWQG